MLRLTRPSLTCLLLFTAAFGKTPYTFGNESVTPLYPPALVPGDTIRFVAPAGGLDEERILLAKRRLEEMGFVVQLPDNLFRKLGYLAGSDEQRAAELIDAFADPNVDAIFPGTGGYGATRILDKLDYDVIRCNPKILVGFSDITGLHIAINQRTGLITFHSPVPQYGLGSDTNLSPFAAKWFWRALLKSSYRDSDLLQAISGNGSQPKVIPISPADYVIAGPCADSAASDTTCSFEDARPSIVLAEGKARGRLTGGNLSVLHALMGTPYEMDTAGKILFLEDVGEEPYRVDRMLSTLRLAGKFDKVAGVVLGQFTAREGEAEWDDDTPMAEVLRQYFADLGVPVLADFPVGHVRDNATLPIGAMAELDATSRSLRLLENPIELSSRPAR